MTVLFSIFMGQTLNDDFFWVTQKYELPVSFKVILPIWAFSSSVLHAIIAPALFQNIFKFCTFLPKFSKILPFFNIFKDFFAYFLENRTHALTL